MVTKAASSETDIVSLVDTYARRICPAVLEQHPSDSVSSALGIWLLLAACATATSEAERSALEDALGCSTSQAAALLAGFLEAPPAALRTAMALWVRSADRTASLVEWSASLPPAVERGPVPSQAAADAWTERQTQGLIARFPIELSKLTRLVLASVLATKVSWETPYVLEAAVDHVRPSSPWHGRIQQVLIGDGGGGSTMLADTEAAGVVAVHLTEAVEDLGVLCVAADPAVDRRQVFEAAYELARRCRSDTLGLARRSLFDLPLGEGPSWLITEHEVATNESDARLEKIESVVLPAWRSENELDLKASALFGAQPALDAFLGLVGPSAMGDQTDAAQSVVASFTPTGFEAAAASVFALRAGAVFSAPTHRGVERRAKLLFDHPFAAIALAGSASDFRRAQAGHSDLFCLPLFSAWVETPADQP
jgi:hypothetical protein